MNEVVFDKDVFNHMIAVISGQVDIIGIGAVIPDITKIHIVPDENVVIFKIDIFLNGYTIETKRIGGFGIGSVISDIVKVYVPDFAPEGIR